MIKKRSELEEKLDRILTNYNANKKVCDAVQDNITAHGISVGEFQEVWKKNKTLDSVNEILLFLFTKYLYEITKEEEIKPEDYFTETEITDGNNYKKEIINDVLSYPITFENVIKGTDDQFIMYLSIQEIKKLFDNSLITYNFDTQRNPKHELDKEGDLIKVANVNKQSVKQIAEFFLDGKFLPNTITFNLLQDGEDQFSYNSKNKTLTVASGQINIIDGFHRTLGMIEALGTNPNLEYKMEIRFTNWDVKKCRVFIHQENIRNKINSKYLASVINTEKWGNKVVTKLNEGQSDLSGKITTDTALIKIYRAFTMFDMMSNTIDYLWDIKTNMEVNNIAKYLSEFFDYVIGYNVEDFIQDLKKSQEMSIITYPAMFVGYLAIAYDLQDNNNWQDKLKQFFENTDFSLNNPIWVELNIIDKVNSKSTLNLKKSDMKTIVNYFIELMK